MKPLDHIEKNSKRLSVWLLIVSILVGLIGVYQIFSILWVLAGERGSSDILMTWAWSQGIISIVGVAGALGTLRKTYVGWGLLVTYLGCQTASIGYSTWVILVTTIHRDYGDLYIESWMVLSVAKVIGFLGLFILTLLPATTKPFKASTSFRMLIGVSGWLIFTLLMIFSSI